MKVKFISLASGSSGNCYYLGTETYGILIDAGIGIRTIKKTLKDYYMDNVIELVADQVVDEVGTNFTQQLYEQMKRNYNIE